ncbi:MAG TPA: choice-of-anchor V domain-containing protein [Bryobacteraceae bacterium]|nr:choice-of-anchor V domain-containing protein [Bryobacteraceae bacterium]
MQHNRKILAAKMAVGLAVIPVLIYAYSTGPDPRHTAAPGDDPQACATSGCHTGTPLNGGGGNVQLTSSAGTSYTPGQSQTLTLTITDSKAHVYGFQMSARLDSSPSTGQAGDFTAGTQQIVLCDDGSLKGNNGCPSKFPVEFIEHSSPFQTNTIKVKWTAPATNVGTVTIYAAANAANGDANNTGDHIYTTKLQLSPASTTNNGPTITGIQSAGGFNPKAGIAAATWIEIYGTNLSTTPTRSWAGSDFNGNNAPTSLDGVSVTVGGKSAFVDFISSGQVNVQVPDNIPLGPGVPVVLTTSQGQSSPVSVTTASLAPALLALPQWDVNSKQYVVAQFPQDGNKYVGPTNLINGLTFRPAKPGEVITIYGIGFGPVTPANPSGTVTTQGNTVNTTPVFRFGQTPAELQYQGLSPFAVGLYQFNVVVPNVSAGDIQLNVQMGSITLNQSLFVTVGQ